MNPLKENKCNIKCEWMKNKRALINPDGQVWPCCYLANIGYAGEKVAKPGANFMYHIKHKSPTFNSYFENRDEMNVFKKSLDEILEHDWFTKTLPDSWNDSDILLPQCKKFCQSLD